MNVLRYQTLQSKNKIKFKKFRDADDPNCVKWLKINHIEKNYFI